MGALVAEWIPWPMVQWFTVHARTAQGPEEEAPRGAAGSESPRWRALRDGDEDAFAELFRTHYAALCTVADRLLRVPAEAEEVVQDVFLRLWERRESLEAVADEGAYLRTAVRRRVIDRVRRSQTEATVIAHIAHEPVLSDIPDDDAARLLGAVRAAFVHLTPRCRAAMTLRWFERRSHAEIAALLEISPKGVERLITRGLATLRRVLPAEEDS